MRYVVITLAVCGFGVGGLSACTERAPEAKQAGDGQASTPLTFGAIPMFPGLTAVGEQPISLGGTSGYASSNGKQYETAGGMDRVYATTATAEKVYAFYLQHLGGKVGSDSADDRENFGRGEATPVIRSRYIHNLEDFEDALRERMITGTAQRALLQANRPASPGGDWIREGMFSWTVNDPTGGFTDYLLRIEDKSINPHWDQYAPRTEVTISTKKLVSVW